MFWRIFRKVLVIVVMGLLIGGLYGAITMKNKFMTAFFANMASQPATVSVEQVGVEGVGMVHWEQTLLALGTIRANHSVELSASVGGVVQTVALQSGQPVAAGAALVQLDQETETGNLKAAQAALALSQVTVRRTGELVRGKDASPASFDQATADLHVKEAQVDIAKAALAKRTVAAPFGGVAGVVKLSAGQYLNPG